MWRYLVPAFRLRSFGRRGTGVALQAFFLLLCLLWGWPACALQQEKAQSKTATPTKREEGGLTWSEAVPGIELGVGVLPESSTAQTGAVFVVLRVSSAAQHIALGMASESGEPLAPYAWSASKDLRAGINASMYLPDMRTSNGYMRSGAAVNNARTGSRMGAFFAAGPRKKGLPRADIIERGAANWERRLHDYDIVVQNFRLVDGAGRALWADTQAAHSVAAVGVDSGGRLLFILCQEPVRVTRFVECLKGFHLNLRSIMYVEGGRQAVVFLRMTQEELAQSTAAFPGATAHLLQDDTVYVWKGRQSLFNVPGSPQMAVPNIIGVRMP